MQACWAQDPAQRPPFDEVVAALTRLLDSDASPHSPPLLRSAASVDSGYTQPDMGGTPAPLSGYTQPAALPRSNSMGSAPPPPPSLTSSAGSGAGAASLVPVPPPPPAPGVAQYVATAPPLSVGPPSQGAPDAYAGFAPAAAPPAAPLAVPPAPSVSAPPVDAVVRALS
jgi:hypothetical protein